MDQKRENERPLSFSRGYDIIIAPCAAQSRAAAKGTRLLVDAVIQYHGMVGLTETKDPAGKNEKPSCPVCLKTPEGPNVERVSSGAEGQGEAWSQDVLAAH